MINEHDINDWEMEFEPLVLSTLEKNDVFSFPENPDQLFRAIGKYAHGPDMLACYVSDTCLAGNTFMLPLNIKVYRWVQK